MSVVLLKPKRRELGLITPARHTSFRAEVVEVVGFVTNHLYDIKHSNSLTNEPQKS